MENVKLLENNETSLVGMDDTSILKNHNIRVYYDLKKELLEKKYVVLETCPGSGKSYISTQLIKNMKFRALVVVTTLAIKSQWHELFNDYNVDAHVITYSSLMRMTTYEVDMYIDNFDIVITDEAHHVLADRWSENLMYIRDTKDVYMLGLTADSIRWTDSQTDVSIEFFKAKVIGYTLEEFYNKRLAEPFTYICGVYDKASLKSSIVNTYKGLADNPLIGKLCTSIDNVDEINSILNRYKNKLPMKKIIVFVETYDDLVEAQQCLEKLHVKHFMLHSRHGKYNNAAVLKAFKKCTEPCAIFCINILSEGVHIPGVDTVIMLRRTYVPNMYIQQIGRIVSVGAKAGTAVFDFVCNHINISSVYGFSFGDGSGNTFVRLKALSDQIIIDDYLLGLASLISELDKLKEQYHWADWEDTIIRENYGKYGAKYCQTLLPHRNMQQIWDRASKLGVNVDVWSEDIDIIIIANWNNVNRKKILTRLIPDWPYGKIHYRAGMLGLDLRQADALLDEEIDVIRANYQDMTNKELATAINALECNIKRECKRTPGSVANLKSRLGLALQNNWSNEDISILREWYPKIGAKVKDMLNSDRTEDAIRRVANTLGIKFNGDEEATIDLDLLETAFNKHEFEFSKYPVELRKYADGTLMHYLNLLGHTKKTCGASWDWEVCIPLLKEHGRDYEFFCNKFPDRTKLAVKGMMDRGLKMIEDEKNGIVRDKPIRSRWDYDYFETLFDKYGGNVSAYRKHFPDKTDGAIKNAIRHVRQTKRLREGVK